MIEQKDGNPKDAIGSTKVPLSLVPETAIAYAALAHYEGATKYGRWNWRKSGVRASIYLDACKRHLAKWTNGEECDPATGVPHLGNALACINIIIDARACGKLVDDRPPSADLGGFLDALAPLVRQLTEAHAGLSPRHYSIADTEPR